MNVNSKNQTKEDCTQLLTSSNDDSFVIAHNNNYIKLALVKTRPRYDP